MCERKTNTHTHTHTHRVTDTESKKDEDSICEGMHQTWKLLDWEQLEVALTFIVIWLVIWKWMNNYTSTSTRIWRITFGWVLLFKKGFESNCVEKFSIFLSSKWVVKPVTYAYDSFHEAWPDKDLKNHLIIPMVSSFLHTKFVYKIDWYQFFGVLESAWFFF